MLIQRSDLSGFSVRRAVLSAGLFLLVACGYVQMANAADAQTRGMELAVSIDQRDSGFTDSISSLTMTLTNEAGDSVVRTLSIKTLEVQGDGDKTVTLFESPRDVKGSALLTWSHALEDDEQWLYLPAIGRVKRVSSKNKSGPFMGSEFSYEDLSSQELEKFSYRYIKEELLDGVNCHVSERIPAYKHSGYARQVSWIDQATLNTLKTEYYDRGNKLLKTLYQSDHRQYANGHWRAHKMVMVNHQTLKKSTLSWGEFKFGNRFAKSQFTKNRLKSSR